MSFFTEPKNAGIALIVVALLNVLAGIIGIYDGATGGFDTGAVVAAIGAIICALVLFGFGKKVAGNMLSKIGIVEGYVQVIGITTVIGGVFGLGYMANGDISGAIVSAIVSIVLGLIVLWVASRINDGKKDTLDKVIWILLVLIMVIMILVSIIGLLDFFVGTIIAICDIIIYIFLLLLLLDADVKSKMGM